MNRVKDKVAIVTGAAQGIGQAISQVLAEEGAWVLVTDLNGELAEKVEVWTPSGAHQDRRCGEAGLVRDLPGRGK